MLTNDPKIASLKYQDKISKMMESEDGRAAVSKMSFKDYVTEAGSQITPPSGQPIAPTGPSTGQPTNASAPGVEAIWPGQGAPLQQGMTVGLKGPNGIPVPGTVSQVDQGAQGVKVKNPTTGQYEWHNDDELQPFMAKGALPGANAPQQNPGVIQATEDTELVRLKELAGLGKIRENCSGGATGAGAIAIAPTGNIGKKPIKREYTQEAKPVEYKPTTPAQTIVGDTKPNQATGKLSADLAARKQKTASRTNNGFKR